jgi:hypothetical protein
VGSPPPTPKPMNVSVGARVSLQPRGAHPVKQSEVHSLRQLAVGLGDLPLRFPQQEARRQPVKVAARRERSDRCGLITPATLILDRALLYRNLVD